MPGPPKSTGDHKLNLTEVERALIYAQGKVLTLLVTTLQAKVTLTAESSPTFSDCSAHSLERRMICRVRS